MTDPDGGVTRYTYDAVGNLVRTELPNGTSETREYDDLNRLTFLENRGPSGVISSYRYTLAATGRRDAVVEDTGRRVDYGYDALDRLIDESDHRRGRRQPDDRLHLRPGRQPADARTTRPRALTTYTYDANDRLLTETLARRGDAVHLRRQRQHAVEGHRRPSTRRSTTGTPRTAWSGPTSPTRRARSDIAYRYDADGIRVASDGRRRRDALPDRHGAAVCPGAGGVHAGRA